MHFPFHPFILISCRLLCGCKVSTKLAAGAIILRKGAGNRHSAVLVQVAGEMESGGGAPKKKGSLLWRSFWAAHQRFFRYMCMAAKVSTSKPSLLLSCPCH